MEELRSTDILDREIRDDARRKAEKSLAASEAECALIASETASRLDADKASKKDECAKALASYERDVAAAIPLEKERRLVSFVDAEVRSALDARLADLGPTGRLSLYGRLLSRYSPRFNGVPVRVFSVGFAPADARAAADRAFGRERVVSSEPLDPERAARAGCSDGIIVEAEDGSIVCRASIEEVRGEILDSRRQELAEALFGGRLPE